MDSIKSVLQFLERDAKLYGDKVALEDESAALTYEEYLDAAKRIGSFLCGVEGDWMDSGDKRASGEDPKQASGKKPVAVLIDRNIKCIAAFMGVVYSGNFYVPIDASMPQARIAVIFDTLKPVAVIDARKTEGGFEAPCKNQIDASKGGLTASDGETFPLPIALYSDIIKNREIDDEVLARVRSQAADSDPLYSIFTSGSTGVPKGVLISHRGVINLLEAFKEAFDFSHDSIFGNQAPFDFDVSVKDIYNALYVGGTVCVLEQKLFMMPKLLIDRLREKRIDTLIWAVSALRIVSDFKAFDEKKKTNDASCGFLTKSYSSLPYIKNVMFSGEVMPPKALNYWMDHIPEARYVNLYGPTEITCNCTYFVVDRRFMNDEALPAGRPFKNMKVFLIDFLANPADILENSTNKSLYASLDVYDKNVDFKGTFSTDRFEIRNSTGVLGNVIKVPNMTGEICVEGPGVALGYYNNPKKTREAFIRLDASPESESKPVQPVDGLLNGTKSPVPAAQHVIYRTGDLGYYNESGELMFAGRADSQIKHMGHRIELGEIEAALNAIDFLTISCCLYDNAKDKIVCFYEAKEECKKDIVLALSKKLPKYMWPNVYVRYEALPVNSHGKIDRAALKETLMQS